MDNDIHRSRWTHATGYWSNLCSAHTCYSGREATVLVPAIQAWRTQSRDRWSSPSPLLPPPPAVFVALPSNRLKQRTVQQGEGKGGEATSISLSFFSLDREGPERQRCSWSLGEAELQYTGKTMFTLEYLLSARGGGAQTSSSEKGKE